MPGMWKLLRCWFMPILGSRWSNRTTPVEAGLLYLTQTWLTSAQGAFFGAVFQSLDSY